MYRRLSIRLLCLALITFFTLPALAQFTRDNAASKKIDEAINEHYLATDFDKAEAVLTGTINACADKCSPGVIAKAWMYVGIVRGSGKNDQNGAKDAFQKALALDPSVKLDTQLATPETQATFAAVGGSGGTAVPEAAAEAVARRPRRCRATKTPGDKGGLKCTPDVREVQTRRPIPVQCTSDEEAASMELRYKPFGADTWKTVKMKKKDDAFRGEVPCDGTGTSGTLKVYVRAKDAAGESVDSFGSKSKPIEFQLSESSTRSRPPTTAKQPPLAAPTRASARRISRAAARPPQRAVGKDWGVVLRQLDGVQGKACSATTARAKRRPLAKLGRGLPDRLLRRTASAASIARARAAAASGRRSLQEELGRPAFRAKTSRFRRRLRTCAIEARFADGQWLRLLRGRHDGPAVTTATPTPARRHRRPASRSPRRASCSSYDRAFTPYISLGGRVGFAFGGGPPAGQQPPAGTTDPAAHAKGTGGTPFLPLHLEVRGQFWFVPLTNKLFHAVRAIVGGGMAQVDAKVKVRASTTAKTPARIERRRRVEPGSPTRDPGSKYYGPPYRTDDGISAYNQCRSGKKILLRHRSTTRPCRIDDAWKKMGQGFITEFGGGRHAPVQRQDGRARSNVKIMYMLPASGVVIQPALGFIYGF